MGLEILFFAKQYFRPGQRRRKPRKAHMENRLSSPRLVQAGCLDCSAQPDQATPPLKKARSALKTIRAFCTECQGGLPQAVSECADIACLFYPYRHGKALARGQHQPVKAIRRYCFNNCLPGAGAKSVRDCGGDTALLGPCPVFSFRLGKNPNFSEATRLQRRQRALELNPLGLQTLNQTQHQVCFDAPESTKRALADL